MIKMQSNVSQILNGYLEKLQSLTKGGVGYDSALREVATTMRAEMSRRIHSEGKNSQGADIGHYSTEPIYVSTKNNPGRSFGRPIGKTGKSKFKGGEKAGADHTSRYFAGGYNEYKTAIGRNTLGKVNLSLSGQLAAQFAVVETNDGYGIGWVDTEKRERAGHLQQKYGAVWSLTQQEKELSKKIAEQKIKEILN